MHDPSKPKKSPLERCNALGGRIDSGESGTANRSTFEPAHGGVNSTEGEGSEGGCVPEGRAPSDLPISPWYSPHTGTLLQKLVEINDKRDGHFRVKIYPSGVILEKFLGFAMPRNEGANRGRIEGFSDEAARRLKEAFMSRFVPDFDLWAFTLTTHQIFTPEQWRAITMRFRQAVKRAGWSGIWRVELQRRKAPHAHVAFWLPRGVGHDDVTALWLQATGETNDTGAREHAVMSKRIPQDETGWAVYMGCHNGKKKESQLGWLGKQWGIWNEKQLVERIPDRCELDSKEHPIFLRVLRHLDVSQRRAINRARDVKMLESVPIELRGNIHFKFEKVKARSLHKGNLLRCVKGETVLTIIRAIKDGKIYSKAKRS